ncbi:MAG: hypothetical protein M1832_002169 [Thelocarpon impressellum]|nr:MAG: hypothetical protein M1832_002169 [Thelocarpon impressellum]
MSDIVDDKTQHCAPFILERLAAHRREHARLSGNTPPPFFLGLNGVQGAGKTTLVSTLCSTLRSPPHNTPTLVFSIDDLYLTHDAQVALAAAHQDNELIQHRGQPGTHDVDLALSIFYSLYHRLPTAIPAYDKAAYDGQGERTDPATWVEVNRPDQQPIEVVIFEGWCVAFRSLDEAELRFRWEAARRERDGLSRIWRHDFNHLSFVNDALRAYDGLTDKLDALIHM